MAKVNLIDPDELEERERQRQTAPRPRENRSVPPVQISITAEEREPWSHIAKEFGWFVSDGPSAKSETPNPHFNEPIRRLAAAWVKNNKAAKRALTAIFDNASPSPDEMRKARQTRWADNVRLNLEEAKAWDAIAGTFNILRGRNPFALEAMRRIGVLALRDAAGWEIVTSNLRGILPLEETFVRLGSE